MIADEKGVESIAGIMGGEHSGCDETTTDVLIESALWDPHNIAQTGRKLGIITDARYRFERGVDPLSPCLASISRPAWSSISVAASRARRWSPARFPDRLVIEFPWTEVPRLSGLDVPPASRKVILEQARLRDPGSGERVSVAAPSWRPDIEGKADLVEEVIRIAGVDRSSHPCRASRTRS